MARKPDKLKDDQTDLPGPPESADKSQRQQLADRLIMASDTAPSLRDLRKRAGDLPPGHASSPYAADGTLRPDEPSLKDVETPEPPLTDAQWIDHLQDVTVRLDKAFIAGLATDQLHTVDTKRQIWSAERNKLHGMIIAEIHSKAADVPSDRLAIVAGGLGGAGKSTVLDQCAGIDRSKYLTINPDQFKEELAKRDMLPKIPGLSPMEASALGHAESSYLARRLAVRALADGKNVIWDITMSSTETTSRRIDELRNADYKRVDTIYVDIPVETSIARAEARHRHGHDLYLAGQGLGGRALLAEVSRSQVDAQFGSANRRAFESLKHRFDHWTIYDNSVDGRQAVLVDSGRGNPRGPGDAGTGVNADDQ